MRRNVDYHNRTVEHTEEWKRRLNGNKNRRRRNHNTYQKSGLTVGELLGNIITICCASLAFLAFLGVGAGIFNGDTTYKFNGEKGSGLYKFTDEYYQQFQSYNNEWGIANLQVVDMGLGIPGIQGSLILHDLKETNKVIDYIQVEIPLKTSQGRHLGVAIANTLSLQKGVQWDFMATVLNFNTNIEDIVIDTNNIEVVDVKY
ncbi:MAG: FxLYD domain-containing protein [Romboutsia sp.]|uniref:FxLYD domain-containing protein n=1 Tax=Romboutsia sp. TaxID=1965302 RepID=UPI003F3E9937